MDKSVRPLSEVLHHAIATGDFETVQALLEKGLDADSPLIAQNRPCSNSINGNIFKSAVDVSSIDSKKNVNTVNCTNKVNTFKCKSDMNIIRDKSVVKESWVGYTSNDSGSRDSLKETPIIESDYEGGNEDLISSVDISNHTCHGTHCEIDNALERQISYISLKKTASGEVGNGIEKDDVWKAIKQKDAAEIKMITSCGNIKFDAASIASSEQELLTKLDDDHPNCESIVRPISYIVPTLTSTSNHDSIDERLNDNNEILIERKSSVSRETADDELLIEEKPLKLLPRIKRRLSSKWRKDQKRGKVVVKCDQELRKPKNVDNEQLNENYDGLAFFEAVQQGMDMTVQTLLETSNNCQLNLADENGFSPLMQAAWHGQSDCLKVLLDHGANVMLRNITGCTAMHFAAARGHSDCLKSLVNYDRKTVNFQTKFGATPLILASKGGYSECVSIILQNGADANAQYRGNQNSLLFASGNGHYECMELLLDHGIEIDQANSQGVTPLMRAIQQGHTECARLLIDRGASTNLQDVIGRTPAHFAIEYDNPEALKLLIKVGASIELKTKGESTPLDYAEKFENTKCEEILEMHQEFLKEKALQEKEVETQVYKEQRKVSCFSCFFVHRTHRKSNEA